MAWQEVARGDLVELANIGQYESEFPEGSNGLLTLYLSAPVPQWVIDELNQLFYEQGVPAHAEIGSPIVNIYFQKGFPWLAVIAVLVLGLAILIVSWRLFKEIAGAGPVAATLWAIAAISAAVVAGAIVLKRASGR